MSLSAPQALVQSKSVSKKSNETKLLEYFASLDGAEIRQANSVLFGQRYFFVDTAYSGYFGFGRGFSRSQACVKSIAECLERKFMSEAFHDSLKKTPNWQRTSNGFAVHFDKNEAAQSSLREAIERHILQMTYFRDGWAGFYLLDETTEGEYQLQRVISRYECSGYRAGLVIARSKLFAGVAMGYICDLKDGFESSVRWRHAYFEAVDKIKPMLKMLERGLPVNLKSVERASFEWLSNADYTFNFSNDVSLRKLPNVKPVTRIFELASKWNLDFSFFGAFSSGENILPLLLVDRISASEVAEIKDLFQRLGLPPEIPNRNPIL